MWEDLLKWIVGYHLNAKRGRRAELLRNSAYMEVLNKYR